MVPVLVNVARVFARLLPEIQAGRAAEAGSNRMAYLFITGIWEFTKEGTPRMDPKMVPLISETPPHYRHPVLRAEFF